jgi:hypothetical protein
MASRLVRFLLSLLLALLISAGMTFAISWTWQAIGGGGMSVHGWIALLIGTFGTVGLAWGLMALAFKSNREGWDDRVDNSLDPGRDASDDDRG